MKVRAVQALVEVEDNQLPVCFHVINDSPAEPEVAHAPRGKPVREVAQLRAQRPILPIPPFLPIPPILPLPPELDEDVPVPGLAASSMERIVLLAEFRRHMRRREQPSIEVVRPRVIGALDATGEMTFRLLAQLCAAVTAHVEQRVDLTRSVARDDHAVVPKRAREVIAGVGNLIGAPGADPAVDVEALQLRAVEIRIGVEAPR